MAAVGSYFSAIQEMPCEAGAHAFSSSRESSADTQLGATERAALKALERSFARDRASEATPMHAATPEKKDLSPELLRFLACARGDREAPSRGTASTVTVPDASSESGSPEIATPTPMMTRQKIFKMRCALDQLPVKTPLTIDQLAEYLEDLQGTAAETERYLSVAPSNSLTARLEYIHCGAKETSRLLQTLLNLWRAQHEEGAAPIESIILPEHVRTLAQERAESFTTPLVLGDPLGSGSYGEVSPLLSNPSLVVKRMPIGASSAKIQDAYKEAAVSLLLGDHWSTPVYAIHETAEGVDLIMKRGSGGTLHEGDAGPAHYMRYLGPFLHTLSFFEKHGIVHKDIKWDNILGGRLLDAGIVGLEGDPTLVGTPYHLSPGLLESEGGNSHKSDMWAFGTIVFQAFTGERFADALCLKHRGHPPRTVPGLMCTLVHCANNQAVINEVIAEAAIPDEAKRFLTFILQGRDERIPGASRVLESEELEDLLACTMRPLD